MRGLEVEVSLSYFLESCGLIVGKIKLLYAYKDPNRSNVFVIMLYGEDERLPKVRDEATFPTGQIVMSREPNTSKVTGRIVVNK